MVSKNDCVKQLNNLLETKIITQEEYNMLLNGITNNVDEDVVIESNFDFNVNDECVDVFVDEMLFPMYQSAINMGKIFGESEENVISKIKNIDKEKDYSDSEICSLISKIVEEQYKGLNQEDKSELLKIYESEEGLSSLHMSYGLYLRNKYNLWKYGEADDISTNIIRNLVDKISVSSADYVPYEELISLNKLLEAGILTKSEFDQKKHLLLRTHISLQKDNQSNNTIDVEYIIYDGSCFENDEDYGLVPEKPIMIAREIGEKKYLSCLSTRAGEKFTWEFSITKYVDEIKQDVEEYNGYFAGMEVITIYLNCNGKDTSQIAPHGMYFTPGALSCNDSSSYKIINYDLQDHKIEDENFVKEKTHRNKKSLIVAGICLAIIVFLLVVNSLPDPWIYDSKSTKEWEYDNGAFTVLMPEDWSDNDGWSSEDYKTWANIDSLGVHASVDSLAKKIKKDYCLTDYRIVEEDGYISLLYSTYENDDNETIEARGLLINGKGYFICVASSHNRYNKESADALLDSIHIN